MEKWNLQKLRHLFWLIVGNIQFMTANSMSKMYPTVKGWFSQLRKEEGDTVPIGAAGFCWGGRLTVLLAAEQGEEGVNDSGTLIDAGFAAHPSRLSIPSDVEKLVTPVAFALGGKDDMLPQAERDKIREVVEALPERARGEVRIYEGCGHGFAVRADVHNPVGDTVAADGAAQAEEQCLGWFRKHFRVVP